MSTADCTERYTVAEVEWEESCTGKKRHGLCANPARAWTLCQVQVGGRRRHTRRHTRTQQRRAPLWFPRFLCKAAVLHVHTYTHTTRSSGGRGRARQARQGEAEQGRTRQDERQSKARQDRARQESYPFHFNKYSGCALGFLPFGCVGLHNTRA